MKRSPMRRRSWLRPRPRRQRDRHDTAFLAFVRQMPCISCFKPSPSEASHVTIGLTLRGVGMKVPDRHTVPHCARCHRDWDGRRGKFAGWSREERLEQATSWVRAMRMAAIPEDREQAEAFQALGLGRMEDDGAGGFAWIEGSTP